MDFVCSNTVGVVQYNFYSEQADIVIKDNNGNLMLAPFAPADIKNVTLLEKQNAKMIGGAVYVVLSHGKNNKGAYNKNGVQNAVSTNANEIENSDFDEIFVEYFIKNSTIRHSAYDDYLLFKTKTQLVLDVNDLYYRYNDKKLTRKNAMLSGPECLCELEDVGSVLGSDNLVVDNIRKRLCFGKNE